MGVHAKIISPETKATALKMKNKGYSLKLICSKLNLSRYLLNKVLSEPPAVATEEINTNL